MLSRKHRLRGARDIRSLFRSGWRVETEFFTVWLSRAPQKAPRATIVVPRAVDKRAVARNKVKRRAREALRLIIKGGLLTKNIIVRPKAESKNLSSKNIKNILCDIINLP